MRGFELVGRVDAIWGDKLWFGNNFECPVERGDIIAVSACEPGGMMRCGMARVKSVELEAEVCGKLQGDVIVLRTNATTEWPAVAVGDYVHVARALGEHAFGTVNATQ